jgi:predicted MFS family arabinose efflux permease
MPRALIVVATVLAHAAFNGTRLNLSLFALGEGASPLAVGALMSLFAALPMFLGIAAGRFVDRVGVRGPILWATAVLGAFILVPAFLPRLGVLYVAAAGIGGAFTLFHICIQHAVGESSSAEDRKANFGWLALGFSISNFLGPTTAGVAIDHFGHRATFCLSAVLAAAAFAWLFVKRAGFSRYAQRVVERSGHSALDLLRNAELRRVFLVTGLLASAWDLFTFAVPVYGTAIGLSASTIGSILGSFALATFVVRVALPWLSRHFRDWVMISGTMAIGCVAYALFPLFTSVPLLAAIAFLLGLGLGSTQPSIMSLLYSTAPEGRAAEAVGIRSTVLNASTTVLPLAFGGVGAALGMTPVFWGMAAALGAGGVLADRHRRRVHR